MLGLQLWEVPLAMGDAYPTQTSGIVSYMPQKKAINSVYIFCVCFNFVFLCFNVCWGDFYYICFKLLAALMALVKAEW